MDLWLETSVGESVGRTSEQTSAHLTAHIRVTNRGDEPVEVDSGDFRFRLLNSQNSEVQVLGSPEAGASSIVRVEAGGEDALDIPLTVSADVIPDETYVLSWEWGEETGRTDFKFL